MSKCKTNWHAVLLIAACLVLGYGELASAAGSGSKPTEIKGTKLPDAQLNTAALMALIGAKTPVVILDARTGPDSWISGAKFLNHKSTARQVSAVVKSKNALIVTYCGGVTCPLGKKLATHLKSLGYANVIEYPQGFAEWSKAGNAVEKKAKAGSGPKPTGRESKGSVRKSRGSGSR